MMQSWHCFLGWLTITIVLGGSGGCGSAPEPETAASTASPAAESSGKSAFQAPAETLSRKGGSAVVGSASTRSATSQHQNKARTAAEETGEATSPEKLRQGVLERFDAARMIAAEIEKSTAYAPTLVVWLIDRSASCRELVLDFGQLMRGQLRDLEPGGTAAEPQLLTAVVSFGSDVQFVVDPPDASPLAVCSAVDQLAVDASGKELTFAAIEQTLKKYLPFRTDKRREVLFVVVSDEAGDDDTLVDQVIEAPRRAGIPFYVVGVPAPFGKLAALTSQVEAGLDYKPSGDWSVIHQGPESRFSEKIQLGAWGSNPELELIDSGFGPFALEWLCRATGGRYLALRPDTSEFAFESALTTVWPSAASPRFLPEAMSRYTPDYVSAADYQALLSGNRARQALHDAARLGSVELIEIPRTSFTKGDEATMVRVLSQAQQTAAKLEPTANRWYEMLEKGEADRGKLAGPRWQAGFDLAMGRAAAVKAKVDGYNAMLAALKRGKSFQNPASTSWVLVPADELEGATALQKLIDKSKSYLSRVVQEHPGTPWARLAEKELKVPCGWKWTEQ